MIKHNISRNEYDYILTDTLPVELSELFSYKKFYDYLTDGKTGTKLLNSLDEKLRDIINRNELPFPTAWSAAPLKYTIAKGGDGVRQMNVMQPISALLLSLFVKYYQKDFLYALGSNNVFSLRYHRKNNSLYFKNRDKKSTAYFSRIAKKLDRSIIQQTGNFFKFGGYRTLSSYAQSYEWQQNNSMFAKYAKIDYKSCFDSIYSHSYNHILAKDTNEAKDIKCSNLYFVIDRILQDINGKSSNGVIIGPEFSRMVAEILLQQIDKEVYYFLMAKGRKCKRDYKVGRFVDDIFIFAKDEIIINEVIQAYVKFSAKYRLSINEFKTERCDTPVVMKDWLTQARNYVNLMNGMFNRMSEEDEGYLVREGYLRTYTFKDDFNVLLKNNIQYEKSIVAFVLSSLINKMASAKKDFKIFRPQTSTGKKFVLLEFAFYVYSFCPCFDNTQRILSILNYAFDEIDIKGDTDCHDRMQALLNKYAFIFTNNDLHDTVNLFLLLIQYNLQIRSDAEEEMLIKVKEADDPILWANFLLYSAYDEDFKSQVTELLDETITRKLNYITEKDVLNYEEIWYVLIFNKCKLLPAGLCKKIDEFIDNKIKLPAGTPPASSTDDTANRAKEIIYEYLKTGGGFFYWNVHNIEVLKQITYRTNQRTLFLKGKFKSAALLGSLS